MKAATSTGWISRSHRETPTPQDHQSHQLPLTPTYITPRLAPKPPPFSKPSFKGFQSVFRRPTRAPSENSLHSTYSASTHSSASEKNGPHPYAAMVPAPLPVVSSHDATEDEEECPVCLEPLSFSFRLPGEKPHIVPECGHALHEVSTSQSSYGLCIYFVSSLASISNILYLPEFNSFRSSEYHHSDHSTITGLF